MCQRRSCKTVKAVKVLFFYCWRGSDVSGFWRSSIGRRIFRLYSRAKLYFELFSENTLSLLQQILIRILFWLLLYDSLFSVPKEINTQLGLLPLCFYSSLLFHFVLYFMYFQFSVLSSFSLVFPLTYVKHIELFLCMKCINIQYLPRLSLSKVGIHFYGR